MTKSEVFKTRFSSKDESIFNPDVTIGDVIEGKINYLLEKAKQPPFIIPITKNQICWSDKPFRELAENDYRRIPLIGSYESLKHLPGRKPSAREARKMQAIYGITISWPHDSILDIIQSKFKKIVDAYLKEDNAEMFPIPFKRYFDGDGVVKNPEWNKAEPMHYNYYAGYLMMNRNHIDDIHNFFMSDDAPKWLLYQFEDARAYSKMVYSKRIDRLQKDIEYTEWIRTETVQMIGSITTKLPEADIKAICDIYS